MADTPEFRTLYADDEEQAEREDINLNTALARYKAQLKAARKEETKELKQRLADLNEDEEGMERFMDALENDRLDELSEWPDSSDNDEKEEEMDNGEGEEEEETKVASPDDDDEVTPAQPTPPPRPTFLTLSVDNQKKFDSIMKNDSFKAYFVHKFALARGRYDTGLGTKKVTGETAAWYSYYDQHLRKKKEIGQKKPTRVLAETATTTNGDTGKWVPYLTLQTAMAYAEMLADDQPTAPLEVVNIARRFENQYEGDDAFVGDCPVEEFIANGTQKPQQQRYRAPKTKEAVNKKRKELQQASRFWALPKPAAPAEDEEEDEDDKKENPKKRKQSGSRKKSSRSKRQKVRE